MKTPQIREDVLRDKRYPIHRIADRVLPYLKVRVEQFPPDQVILFGSYAYGKPDKDSDVDLLVEFEAGRSPGYFGLVGMEMELTGLIGRKVDLRTPGELSKYFRDTVVASALPQYERQ